MSARSKWLIGALMTGAIGAGAYCFVVSQKPKESRNEPVGFREMARDAGITFRMNFLPDEQGEIFRINLYDHGCGVAVADFDGDGHDDIYFLNQLGPNALYRNKGNGTFEDVTAKAGVALGDRICVGAAFADTTNNGLQDLYVTSTRGGNVFFRNQGDGTFKDETKKAGLIHVGHSQTAVFFDYDNDGYLDLFVTNSAAWTNDTPDKKLTKYFPGPADFWKMANSRKEHNILYHNNRDGTFTDVTAKAGLLGQGWGGDVAVLDYDEDGHMDILVTNMFGLSQLYHNNGDGTFTDVTKKVLGRTSWGAIGSKAFDFDNDGRLDLLIVDMHSDMWVPFTMEAGVKDKIEKKYAKRKFKKVLGAQHETDRFNAERQEAKFADLFKIKYDEVVFGNTLFRNLGGGKFKEVSDKAGMETFWPWGIATGDFDNDGFEDVYLPSGMGFPYFYWPSALMMNNGNGTFTNRAESAGIEPPPGGPYLPEPIGTKPAARSSRCAATADFDGDGRLDIVANNFNDAPYYFRNNFPRKNYVAFRLRGTHSNSDAIGALVRIYITKAGGEEVMVRQVQGAGGYLSQSSKTLHFGLGDRDRIDRAEIRWPRGGRQTIKSPGINQLHNIVEARE